MRSGLHPLCVVVLFRELPGVEQQAPVYFDENLARDGSQQLHSLLEMGFLVLASCGAAVCAVAKVLKMADYAGDICGNRTLWHYLPPFNNQYVLHMFFYRTCDA